MNHLHVLSDNLRLVHQYVPTVRSVSCGVFVGTGSVNESKNLSGISHALEHMMFKGTAKRNCFEINQSVENLGGQMNAYTNKQMTAYYVVVADEHIEKAIDVLSDITTSSLFPNDEFSKEKQVIFEEMAMSDDTPDDLCLDTVFSAFFKGNPLEKLVLGTKKSVDSMDSNILRNYYSTHYTSGNIVVSICGNIKEAEAIDLVKRYFVGRFNKSSISPLFKEKINIPTPKFVKKIRKIEQSNITLAFNGYDIYSSKYEAFTIANIILGNGMSSRLFTRVREKMGLAYSIYSYPSYYSNNGIFIVYAGTRAENNEKCIDAIIGEINNLKKNGITADEFNKAREMVKGSYILGYESTASIMRVLGRYALTHNDFYDIDRALQAFNELTIDDVMESLDVIKSDDINIAYVGKKTETDLLEVAKNAK